MSRKQLILVATPCLVLVAAIVWWLIRAEPEKPQSLDPATSSEPSVPRATPAVLAAATPVGKPKREVMRDVLSTLNHQSIEFYGRVTDQDGLPVPGAEVNGQVIYNTGMTAGVEKPNTVTDASGYFAFSGLNGRTLDFNITKPGYEFMPEGDAFDYTKLVSEEKRHHPDPSNPVVLKMWKLQGAEPLIYNAQTFNLPSDGSPVRIDFAAGKTVADGGDLIVAIKHGQQPAGASVTKYDWSAEVTAVDGGLKEAGQRVTNMHLAPESGYVPSISVEMPATRNDWSRTYTRSFYVKSRGRLYARISFDLHSIPSGGPSYVSLKSWVNPSGSRNLEYDPSKQASAR